MKQKPLTLIALDAEGLNVISAQLQDALVQIGDISYSPAEKRFVMITNRFDWLGATKADGQRKSKYERRRSALRFELISSVKAQNITQGDDTAILDLLAISFKEAQTPHGTITLHFAGGGKMALEAECIEAELKDLGPKWRARSKPDHELTNEQSDA